MEERVLQFRVGVLVAATVIIAVILVVIFDGGQGVLAGRKTVFIHFPSAPGVTVNTPVRKSGILVGRVTAVDLEDDGGVLITARLESNRKIKTNEICRIGTGNFLGDAMLEFVPSGEKGLPNETLEDGAYLEGIVSKDAISMMSDAMQVFTTLSSDLRIVLGSVEEAGTEIGQVAKNLNVLVVNNQDQFSRIMGKTEQAIGRFDTTMIAVQDVVTDEELMLKLKQALDEVPQVLADTSNLIAGLSRVADEAEQNLVFLQGLTKPLGERGDEIASSLTKSLRRLDGVMLELQQFTKAINESEGTLGQFVHNPDLYQRLNNAAANIEDITFQLQPIVDDARVISDKMARNPGRILRGAIGRQQSGLK
ncbi:MAG: MlaD family protein [Pirellulaceae bacterium]|nr:MlaD family protein [Pirellulaceae bacterium]